MVFPRADQGRGDPDGETSTLLQQHYDAVVVGAGPAGSREARDLAAAGFRDHAAQGVLLAHEDVLTSGREWTVTFAVPPPGTDEVVDHDLIGRNETGPFRQVTVRLPGG